MLPELGEVLSLDPKGLNKNAMAPTPTITKPDTNTDEFTESPKFFGWGVKCFGWEVPVH